MRLVGSIMALSCFAAAAAATPAPACTRTWWPCATSFLVVSGVTATRVSPAALSALAQGHVDQFHDILSPTVPLSRHIFQAPTRFYKTGVVFMAWLNGHQSHFSMVGGQQTARSLPHLCELFRLADQAHLLSDPDLAMQRMRALLTVHGVTSA